MKITDYDVIRNGERELIDSINGDLDWVIMENIFQKKHNLSFGEDVEYKKGDIVVHNKEIAYQLDFDVKVNLSILIDREGNFLSISTARDRDESNEEDEYKPAVESKGEIVPDDSTEGELIKDDSSNALEDISVTEYASKMMLSKTLNLL